MLGNALFLLSIGFGVSKLLFGGKGNDAAAPSKRKKVAGTEVSTDECVPPPLQSGDTVAIIAPAGPVEKGILEKGVGILRRWGLNPVVISQVFDNSSEAGYDSDYLAGGDGTRLAAIVDVFADPTYKAVICARGGYGTTRLLPMLTWNMITTGDLLKKRFYGFSDITALHALFNARGVVTFHAPMPATELFCRATPESVDSFKAALFGNIAELPLLQGQELQRGLCVGRVKGPIVGGNLAVLTSLCGTEYQPNFEGCILVLEEVGEAPYKVDRMVNQLVQATGGKLFDQIGALVLGSFGGAIKSWVAVENFWLQRVGVPAHVPVLAGVPLGHVADGLTVPLGANGVVDLDAGTLGVDF